MGSADHAPHDSAEANGLCCVPEPSPLCRQSAQVKLPTLMSEGPPPLPSSLRSHATASSTQPGPQTQQVAQVVPGQPGLTCQAQLRSRTWCVRHCALRQLPHQSDFTAHCAHVPRPTPDNGRPSGIGQACRIQRSVERLRQAQHLCLQKGTLLEQPSKGRLIRALLDVQDGCRHEGGHAGCAGICARAYRHTHPAAAQTRTGALFLWAEPRPNLQPLRQRQSRGHASRSPCRLVMFLKLKMLRAAWALARWRLASEEHCSATGSSRAISCSGPTCSPLQAC